MATKPTGMEAQKITSRVVTWQNEDGSPKTGQTVEGKLLSMETGVKTSMGVNNVYRLEDEAGELLTLFGSAVLNRAMQACHVGDWVIVKLTGTSPSKKKGQSDVKLFEVSRIPAAVVEDDDLPGSPA